LHLQQTQNAFESEWESRNSVIRTRCYGLVGAMIPSRMCCTSACVRPRARR